MNLATVRALARAGLFGSEAKLRASVSMPVENARPLAGHQINNTPMCSTPQGLPKASWLLLAQTCKCVSVRSRYETDTRKRLKIESASPSGAKRPRSERSSFGHGRPGLEEMVIGPTPKSHTLLFDPMP